MIDLTGIYIHKHTCTVLMNFNSSVVFISPIEIKASIFKSSDESLATCFHSIYYTCGMRKFNIVCIQRDMGQ